MLQALLETTPDIVIFKDRDSVYRTCSERHRKLVAPDIPMDRFVGRTVFDVYPEEMAQLYRQEDTQVMETGEFLVAEHLLETEEGPLWFEAVKMPLRNEQGEIIGIFTSERDITDRLKAEAQRDEQRRMLRTLLDTLPDGIIFKDKDLVYRVVNQSYCDLLGYTMEELVGKSDFDIWPEEEAREYQARERELLETGRPICMEKIVETPRGPNYREVVKTPLRDGDGNIIGVLVAGHDITALRLADAQLRRRNQELDAQNALAAAISRSLDLEYVLNTAMEELLRLELVGSEGKGEVFLQDERSGEVSLVAHRGIPEAYLGDALARGKCLCSAAAEQGQITIFDDATYEEGDIHGVDTDPHRNLCLPLSDRDRVLGCINLWLPLDETLAQEDFAFLKSISGQINVAIENANLYEEAKQQHQRVRALSQQLAENTEDERKRLAQDLHDTVGQYLAALGINLNILQRMLPDDVADKAKPHMHESQKLIERMTECVRGVMADLHPPVLDEYGLVSALEWYGDRFSTRTSIEVNVEGEPLVPRLSPNIEVILFRIVQEALANVAKHAKATHAEVTVEDMNGVVRLQLGDNGAGFDVASVPYSRDEWGWGLLAISEWSSAVGGRFTIDSDPGQGTRITVELNR